MSEEVQDDSVEVELDAPPAEEQETLKEKVPSSAESEGGKEPEQEAPAQESDEELEQYSKGVQERIKKLTAKYRQAERDQQEAVRLAQTLKQQNEQLQKKVKGLDEGYLNEYGQRLEAQAEKAKQVYRDAYEAGDTDKMFEAQQLLSKVAIEQERYRLAKNRAEQGTTQTPAPEETQPPAQQVQLQQPQQQPQPDPKAKQWADRNEWFGQDETMTYAAFGIHQKLVEEEGFDPTTDEYYTEIDRRIRAEFPHKFREQKSGKEAPVAPGNSSASRSTKKGRRSVKLTPSQVAIAKKLGVPLEEYAKYVKD